MNTAAKAITQSSREHDAFFAGLVTREHVTLLLLALAVFISSFAVIYTKNCQRNLYIQSQSFSAAANQMQTNWGKLLLEQSAWSQQSRIESIATQKLDMVLPKPRAIVMVQE
jgi:cell division protein FtsL